MSTAAIWNLGGCARPDPTAIATDASAHGAPPIPPTATRGTHDAPSVPSSNGSNPAAATQTVSRDGGAELIPESFEALYPIFLLRKLGDTEKAALWSRYRGRWVRWTGKLVRVTRDGAAVKMLPTTTTFDVSVNFESGGKTRLAAYKPGQPITFVGRLQTFDDVFRSFYLDQGNVAPVPASPPP